MTQSGLILERLQAGATEQAEAGIAQQLYNHYHGIEGATGKAQLMEILAKMNKAQLEQLAGIAAAMV